MKLRCYSNEKLFDLLKNACLKESISWVERKIISESDDELVTPAERDEMLAYLLEVCDRSDMAFNIETFALTVALVDRFLGSYKVKSKYLECLAVSCLYIAAKVREEDEKISITSDFLYDCNSKCSVSELLRMELMILKKFEWSIYDMTSVDFLYLYHAIIINKYNEFTQSNPKPNIVINKWNIIKNITDLGLSTDSAYPPSDLDFLHSLEYKLKQVLCNHELTTVFRPKVIALALLSNEIQKQFNNPSEDNNLLSVINEVLQTLQQHTKIAAETLNECKQKIQIYLETIKADKNLLDSYMDQYYSEMARGHRASSRLSITLSAIAKHLTVIKEEDETVEEETCPDSSRVLSSISNQYIPMNSDQSRIHSTEKKFDSDIELKHSTSYASIVLGLRDQKRKLSENSITDEDYEFDCENHRN